MQSYDREALWQIGQRFKQEVKTRVGRGAACRLLARANLILTKPEYRYVFILGHMRSGSTLLSHILANHADITGAGETHTLYSTPADLPALVVKTSGYLHKPFLREKYIVDQINHDYVSNEVLLAKSVYKCIVLLRQPEATLRSMMKLSIWEESRALDLYVNRLESLSQYSRLLKERALLVEYDDLVEQTDKTLAGLTNFLELGSPLMPNYSTHRMTARIEGHGDPSDNIKVGQIVRTPNHEVVLGDDTLSRATQAFRKCREQLRSLNTVC